VCFGIGIVQGATSIATGVTGADLAVPMQGPDLSWMVYVCCYIDVNNQVRVERCDFDMRSRRRISPESQLFAVQSVIPALAGAEVVQTMFDFRMLVRQRGSRL